MSQLQPSQPAPPHRSFRLTPDGGQAEPRTSLGSAFYLAAVQQAILLILSGLILDGGVIFRRVIVATIAFWCFIPLLLVRRRSCPTAGDIFFVKYGIWPLIAVAFFMAIILGWY